MARPLYYFRFIQIQYGYWGSTETGKETFVKARNEDEATRKIEKRVTHMARLHNGDHVRWQRDALYRIGVESLTPPCVLTPKWA